MKFKKKYRASETSLLGFFVTKDTDIVLDFSDGYTKNTTGVINFTGSDRNPPNPLLTGRIQLNEVSLQGNFVLEAANQVNVTGTLSVDSPVTVSGLVEFIDRAVIKGTLPVDSPVILTGSLTYLRVTKVSGRVPVDDPPTLSGSLSVENPIRVGGEVSLDLVSSLSLGGNFVFIHRAKITGTIPLQDLPTLNGTAQFKPLVKLTGRLEVNDPVSLMGDFTYLPPSFVSGLITLDSEPTLSGKMAYVHRAIVGGEIPLSSDVAVTGSLSFVIPFVVTGTLALSDNPTVTGVVVYKDDVFRGLRVEVPHTHREATPLKADLRSLFSDGTPARKDTKVLWAKLYSLFREQTLSRFGKAERMLLRSEVLYREAWALENGNFGDTFKDLIRLRTSTGSKFTQMPETLTVIAGDHFSDMIRVRASKKAGFREAVPFSFLSAARWNFGLDFRTNYKVKWRGATKVSLLLDKLKPSIPPYIQPRVEDFKLEFRCKYYARNAKGDHILYFGATRCKRPYRIQDGNLFMIENKVEVTRTSDGQSIEAVSGSVSTDIDSWCWSGSVTLPHNQIDVVTQDTAAYPLVDIKVNGDTYRLLAEGYTKTRSFGNTQHVLNCRSISALLSEDYAALISMTNQTEISAVQLVQEIVYNAVGSLITVEWADLVSDIGWVLAPNAVSFSNLSPIEAIKAIVEPVGGVVFSHPSQPVITIKKAYPYAHWETPVTIDHDLPIDIMTNESTNWSKREPSNSVFVTDTQTGNQARVTRRGSSGNRLATEITSSILSTDQSKQSSGKHALTVNNPSEDTSWSFSFLPEIRYLYPCDIMRVREGNSAWWGTVTGVNLNFAVSQDFIDVTYAVNTTRFMEEGLD